MSRLTVYDEAIWDRGNIARLELSKLTLGDCLAALALHEGTFVGVEVWTDPNACPTLEAEGFLAAVVGEQNPLTDDYGLSPEHASFHYKLELGVRLDGVLVRCPFRVGRFQVDGPAFESAYLCGQSRKDEAVLSIEQRAWTEVDVEQPSRSSLVIRFLDEEEAA